MARKAIAQVEGFVRRLLERHLDADARVRLRTCSRPASGRTTIRSRRRAQLLGLPVRSVGDEERELLDLYPQPRGREAAVEYVPAAPGRRGDGFRGQPSR